MKELLQEIKKYFCLRREAKEAAKLQELNAESRRLISIREVYVGVGTEQERMEYGLFLGDNLVELFPDVSVELLTRMLTLRDYYVKIWTDEIVIK